ncbi:MAG: hypothetical protein N3A54_05865 [Patescibacteria group bacterium]|nr:hypothetical protein [Patescibacteria group bacterium]
MVKGILAILLSCLIVIVFLLDMLYKFGNYDIPFIVVFLAYFMLIHFAKLTSKITFLIIISLTILMGYFYIQQGAFRLTERIGEWFYVFLIVGIVQYAYEVFVIKKAENL